MKFVKVTFKSEEIFNKFVASLSETDEKWLKHTLALTVEEFIEIETGTPGFFVVVPTDILKKLYKFFVDYGVVFTTEDLTTKALSGESINVNGLDFPKDFEREESLGDLNTRVNDLARRLYADNATVDIVLDKLNNKGYSSLNDIDKAILKKM